MVGTSSLTSQSARAVAEETQDLIEERNIVVLATAGLSAAGGVVVAQEISDRVAGAVDSLNQTPQDAMDYGAAVLTKFAVATGFALIASQMGTLGLVAGGFMALGALASAGADALEGLLTVEFLPGNDSTTSSTVAAKVTDGGCSSTTVSASSSSDDFGSSAAAGSGF